MKEQEEDINIRSEEFADVMGDVPHWIIRRGIMLLAIIFVLLGICCAVIKYPDTIPSKITLTSMQPSVSVVAKSSGKIKELMVENNQTVNSGDFVAVIENTASTEDVLYLKKFLAAYDYETNNELPNKNLTLGVMQGSFHALYLSLKEYDEFCSLNYFPSKIDFINNKLTAYTKQLQILERQLALVVEQHALAHSKFKRDSLLLSENVLSMQEYETSQGQYIQSQLSYENSKVSCDNMRLQIMQMDESKFETENQFVEKKNTFRNKIVSQIRQLMVDIENWQMQYVLLSPIDGKITFTKYWTINQNINASDEVFNIIPINEIEFVGKLLLPISRSGKVRVGQQVNVRFENFPDNEYGKIKAEVSGISLVPMQEKESVYYSVDVRFPDGLKTTYGKELPFMPLMKGDADVITDDLTILQRIIMPLRKLWDNAIY